MENDVRYIFSKGDLERKDFSIVFKSNGKNNYIPIEMTKELYLFNDCTITTKLLTSLGKAGITLHCFDYYGNYTGTFYPKEQLISGNVCFKQVKYFEENRILIAKAIVNGIAQNIYTVLYHYYRHGKSNLKEYLNFLRKDVPKLLDKTNNIKQVLMIEGTIWARFYDSFKYFLPEEFIMNKRVRQLPNNPMNALVSFGNSILYSKTITQIYHTHLNQSISFLHEPSEGRFSLSLDLCEVFKPIIVFKTIFDCINNKKLKVEKHFIKELNYCILNDEGKKIFLQNLDERFNTSFKHPKLKRNVTYKQCIKLDGYKLIKTFVENKPFIPFLLEDNQ